MMIICRLIRTALNKINSLIEQCLIKVRFITTKNDVNSILDILNACHVEHDIILKNNNVDLLLSTGNKIIKCLLTLINYLYKTELLRSENNIYLTNKNKIKLIKKESNKKIENIINDSSSDIYHDITEEAKVIVNNIYNNTGILIPELYDHSLLLEINKQLTDKMINDNNKNIDLINDYLTKLNASNTTKINSNADNLKAHLIYLKQEINNNNTLSKRYEESTNIDSNKNFDNFILTDLPKIKGKILKRFEKSQKQLAKRIIDIVKYNKFALIQTADNWSLTDVNNVNYETVLNDMIKAETDVIKDKYILMLDNINYKFLESEAELKSANRLIEFYKSQITDIEDKVELLNKEISKYKADNNELRSQLELKENNNKYIKEKVNNYNNILLKKKNSISMLNNINNYIFNSFNKIAISNNKVKESIEYLTNELLVNGDVKKYFELLLKHLENDLDIGVKLKEEMKLYFDSFKDNKNNFNSDDINLEIFSNTNNNYDDENNEYADIKSDDLKLIKKNKLEKKHIKDLKKIYNDNKVVKHKSVSYIKKNNPIIIPDIENNKSNKSSFKNNFDNKNKIKKLKYSTFKIYSTINSIKKNKNLDKNIRHKSYLNPKNNYNDFNTINNNDSDNITNINNNLKKIRHKTIANNVYNSRSSKFNKYKDTNLNDNNIKLKDGTYTDNYNKKDYTTDINKVNIKDKSITDTSNNSSIISDDSNIVIKNKNDVNYEINNNVIGINKNSIINTINNNNNENINNNTKLNYESNNQINIINNNNLSHIKYTSNNNLDDININDNIINNKDFYHNNINNIIGSDIKGKSSNNLINSKSIIDDKIIKNNSIVLDEKYDKAYIKILDKLMEIKESSNNNIKLKINKLLKYFYDALFSNDIIKNITNLLIPLNFFSDFYNKGGNITKLFNYKHTKILSYIINTVNIFEENNILDNKYSKKEKIKANNISINNLINSVYKNNYESSTTNITNYNLSKLNRNNTEINLEFIDSNFLSNNDNILNKNKNILNTLFKKNHTEIENKLKNNLRHNNIKKKNISNDIYKKKIAFKYKTNTKNNYLNFIIKNSKRNN